MIINILLFLFGLALLVKGADFFVKSASSIAKRLGVSEFIIGLTLVSLGTSIPELASAITSSIKHASGLVIGNVTGANIANIGLIIGIAAIFTVIKTREDMVKRDGYLMLLAVFLFFIFIMNRNIARSEGVVFLIFYFSYMLFLFKGKHNKKVKEQFREFIRYFLQFQYITTIRSRIITTYRNKRKVKIKNKKKVKRIFTLSLIKDFMILIASGAVIVFGVRFFINEAIFFAQYFNVSEAIIGITIMSIGTTLPELSVSITAARKGHGNIALGNIIGSCITNIFLIVGIASIIHPLDVSTFSLYYAAPFMILMTLLFLLFLRTKWRIKRIEGITLLSLYIIFMFLVFFGVFR